jgi:hypothetical protein
MVQSAVLLDRRSFHFGSAIAPSDPVKPAITRIKTNPSLKIASLTSHCDGAQTDLRLVRAGEYELHVSPRVRGEGQKIFERVELIAIDHDGKRYECPRIEIEGRVRNRIRIVPEVTPITALRPGDSKTEYFTLYFPNGCQPVSPPEAKSSSTGVKVTISELMRESSMIIYRIDFHSSVSGVHDVDVICKVVDELFVTHDVKATFSIECEVGQEDSL